MGDIGLLSGSDIENLKTALMMHGISSEILYDNMVRGIKEMIIDPREMSSYKKEEQKAIRSLYRRR